jgi:membrane protease YdiL (CAAX protease family)
MMSTENEKLSRFNSASQLVIAVIGVLIALGWPFIANLNQKPGNHLNSVRDDVHTMAAEWIVTLVLCVIAFGLQRLRPAQFHLRFFKWRGVLYMLTALVGAFVLSGIVSTLVAAPKFDIRQIAAVPFRVRSALVLTAAMCEEFIYRGFAIEEIGVLTGNRWVGAAISLALFGLGHIGVYGFSSALLIPTSVGLVITLLYMSQHNLWLCILMHATIDGVIILLLPALFHL